ncbi:MAG: glycosyltransferase family 4 protein [Deltaproteobacteria bacterium]|nr:glycosyltransferase family 4 protein [Deltaproteobacteria bacterium]
MISWWLLTIFGSSFMLTWLMRRYALKMQMLDYPNQRSSHLLPTPRGGGVAIVVCFAVASLLLAVSGRISRQDLLSVCLPGCLVAVVGFMDDRGGLPAKVRLAMHVVAALLAVYLADLSAASPLFWPVKPEWSWLGYPLIIFLLVWVLNLNNFMDGIDGLAAIETLSVSGGGALILWLHQDSSGFVVWLLLLGAATAGFLVWNWPPARIFMGDAGSGFIGIVLGIMALLTSLRGGVSVWSWLILYGIFIVDATFTLAVRIARGEKFYLAHRSHTYQILARRWGSHLKVTLGVLAVNLFWLFPLSFFADIYLEYAIIFAVIAFVPLVWLAIHVGAGRSDS